MQLVRDVLDEQILDLENQKVGKVDGIVIALRKGRPPRVIALELGTTTLARRLHPRLARWVAAFERRFGHEPIRIRFEHVVKTGINVTIDIDARRTGALRREDWLRERVVGRIPGAGR
jgi:hypothetical protein